MYTAETCSEERDVEERVEMALKDVGVSRFIALWGNTLAHIDDLPQQIWSNFPSSGTSFIRMTDDITIRQMCATPQPGELPPLTITTDLEACAVDFLPDLAVDFGFKAEQVASS